MQQQKQKKCITPIITHYFGIKQINFIIFLFSLDKNAEKSLFPIITRCFVWKCVEVNISLLSLRHFRKWQYMPIINLFFGSKMQKKASSLLSPTVRLPNAQKSALPYYHSVGRDKSVRLLEQLFWVGDTNCKTEPTRGKGGASPDTTKKWPVQLGIGFLSIEKKSIDRQRHPLQVCVVAEGKRIIILAVGAPRALMVICACVLRRWRYTGSKSSKLENINFLGLEQLFLSSEKCQIYLQVNSYKAVSLLNPKNRYLELYQLRQRPPAKSRYVFWAKKGDFRDFKCHPLLIPA